MECSHGRSRFDHRRQYELTSGPQYRYSPLLVLRKSVSSTTARRIIAHSVRDSVALHETQLRLPRIASRYQQTYASSSAF